MRRMDDQVKVNGYRIELSEIENVFSKHGNCDKCVALVRNGMIIGYVKTKGGVKLTEKLIEAMKAEASRSLPPYMMPT